MLLNRLANLIYFLLVFTIVFSFCSIVLCVTHMWSFVTRMFELPYLVAQGLLIEPDETKDTKV
jgi:hypothetical protein